MTDNGKNDTEQLLPNCYGSVIILNISLLWYLSNMEMVARSSRKLRLMTLLFILVPTIAILLSLNWALENDDLVTRRKLVELSTGYLLTLREQLALRMDQGAADAAVLFDEKGKVLFPRLSPYPGKKLPLNDQSPTGKARRLFEKARALGPERAIPLLEKFLNESEFANVQTSGGYHLLAQVCCQALEWLDKSDNRRQVFAKTLAHLLNDWDAPIPPTQQLALTRKIKVLAPRMKVPARNGLALAVAYVRANPPRPAVPNELQRTGYGAVWHKLSKNGRRIELFHETSIRGRIRAALRKLAPKGFFVELITPGNMRKSKGQFITSMALLPPLSGWSMEVISSHENLGGNRKWLLVWSALLIVLLGIVTTISGANAMQHHLAVAKMKNSIVTNVSHDLRTPLAAMQVLAETMKDERIENPEQRKEYLSLLCAEIKRMNRLVDNFLSFSRMESGAISYKKEPVEVEELIEEAALALEPRLDKDGCSLEVSVAAELPQLFGDRGALISMLVNLLDNAIKHGGKGKPIKLTIDTDINDLLISVSDQGPGVPPSEANRIFERFYRVDEKATAQSGSGLGLAIVNHVVDGHGGTVTVSEPPGATFTARLPATVV